MEQKKGPQVQPLENMHEQELKENELSKVTGGTASDPLHMLLDAAELVLPLKYAFPKKRKSENTLQTGGIEENPNKRSKILNRSSTSQKAAEKPL